jgi:hypothetical protein
VSDLLNPIGVFPFMSVYKQPHAATGGHIEPKLSTFSLRALREMSFSPQALRKYHATTATISDVANVAFFSRALRGKIYRPWFLATNATKISRYERYEFLLCQRYVFFASVA